MQFNLFTKKFWLIKRANLRMIKYQYFYSWQNGLRLIFAVICGAIFLTLIALPAIIFEWLNDTITAIIPQWMKVDENPEWQKMNHIQRREHMQSLKDWE